MKLERNTSGAIGTNVYLVTDGDACILIDPADDLEATRRFLAGRVPELIVCTHQHLDHTASAAALSRELGCPIAAHALDAAAICTEGRENVAGISGYEVPERIDRILEEGDTVEAGKCRLAVIHTPGHTPGGICLHDPDDAVLIAGDTLFAQSTGRTDFPEGSESDMHLSIRKLAKLPDETKVFPGHGPSTTIGAERWWMEQY